MAAFRLLFVMVLKKTNTVRHKYVRITGLFWVLSIPRVVNAEFDNCLLYYIILKAKIDIQDTN